MENHVYRSMFPSDVATDTSAGCCCCCCCCCCCSITTYVSSLWSISVVCLQGNFFHPLPFANRAGAFVEGSHGRLPIFRCQGRPCARQRDRGTGRKNHYSKVGWDEVVSTLRTYQEKMHFRLLERWFWIACLLFNGSFATEDWRGEWEQMFCVHVCTTAMLLCLITGGFHVEYSMHEGQLLQHFFASGFLYFFHCSLKCHPFLLTGEMDWTLLSKPAPCDCPGELRRPMMGVLVRRTEMVRKGWPQWPFSICFGCKVPTWMRTARFWVLNLK